MSNQSTNDFKREVIKSGHVHLVNYFIKGQLCGQLQLPATSATQNVMVVVDDKGVMELFGICTNDTLDAPEQYGNLKQVNQALGFNNTFIGYGKLSYVTDDEELFVLLDNKPFLSLSQFDLTEQYPHRAKAYVPDPNKPSQVKYYAHLVDTHPIANLDITQIVSDLIVRFFKYVPEPIALAVSH